LLTTRFDHLGLNRPGNPPETPQAKFSFRFRLAIYMPQSWMQIIG